MADGYVSQVQLPNNETYNIRDKELIPRLKATVGHSNKNLLNLKNIKGKTEYGITWTIDEQKGIVTATGTPQSGKRSQLEFILKDIPSGNYYFYGCIGGSGSTYDVYCWDYTTNSRPKQWDGTTNVYSDYNLVPRQLKIVDNHEISIILRINSGVTVNNLIFKPMVWDGDILDDTFEPYQEPTDKLIETKTRAYLNSTVGHACKNLLDITSQTHNSQVVIESIDNKTGSIHISTAGGTKHVGAAWDFSFENGHSYTISFINLLENAHASVTIRRSDTYTIKYSSGALSTLGNKTFTFTFTDEEFPEGAYVSLRCTDGTGVAGAASISQLMLRESIILDDTFESYQIPTDERFKDYLPLSGGTLTGQLFMSGNRLSLKGTNIDSDGEDPSSDTWSNSELDFVDKDNTRVSFLNVQKKANDSTRLELAAQNKNYYNVIDLIVDKDGTKSYFVSDPAAFRTAIGAVNTAQATGYANVVKSDDFTWSTGTLPSLTTKSTTIYPVKSTTTTASKIVSKDTTIYPVKSTTTTATKVTTKSTTIYPVTSTTTTASKVVSKDTTIYPVTSSTTTASKVVSKNTTIYPVKSTTTTATKVTTSSTTFDQITGVGTLPTLTVSGITLELNQGTLPTSSSVTINDVVSNTDVTVPILSSSVTLKQISSISDVTVPILSSSVTLKQISSISDVTVPILSSSVTIKEISSNTDVTVPILSSSVTIKEISSNTDVTVPVLSSSVTISEVSNWSAGTLPSLSWGSVSAVTGVST